jgi:hypothetical protein
MLIIKVIKINGYEKEKFNLIVGFCDYRFELRSALEAILKNYGIRFCFDRAFDSYFYCRFGYCRCRRDNNFCGK